MIKDPHYPYAYDDEGLIIHINQAVKGGAYSCLSCKERMVAITGGNRINYFRHYNSPACAGESYLHKLSKILFHHDYQLALEEEEPFYIHVETVQVCHSVNTVCGSRRCSFKKSICYDLTKTFDQISSPHKEVSLSCYDRTLRPDLLLSSKSNSNHLLFIEFAVTHKCEDYKIATGAKIVEFTVSDIDGVQKLWSQGIKKSEDVGFYNFSIVEREAKQCKLNDCPSQVFELSINKQSDLSIKRKLFSEIPGNKPLNEIKRYSDELPTKMQIAELYKHGKDKGCNEVRCYCCEHSDLSGSYRQVLCTIKRKNVFPIEAMRCIDYKEI